MAVRKPLKQARRTAVYLVVRAAVWMFRWMPRSWALAIGDIVGRLFRRVARREYRRAVTHLTIAFGSEKPPKEIARIARESFRMLALNFVDVIRLGAMSGEEVQAVSVPHHIERAWDALGRGNGVIMLTGHVGCWEMLVAYIATVGIPLSVVSRRLYDQRLEALLVETRERKGMRNLSRGHATRDIVQTLKRGEMVTILIDQDFKNTRGVFVDFFGRAAHTADAPARLALKYGAPIVPIFTWRDGDHLHHHLVGEPIEYTPTGDDEHDILEITARCSKATERIISEHPEQWVWFHERWKTRPRTVRASGGAKHA